MIVVGKEADIEKEEYFLEEKIDCAPTSFGEKHSAASNSIEEKGDAEPKSKNPLVLKHNNANIVDKGSPSCLTKEASVAPKRLKPCVVVRLAKSISAARVLGNKFENNDNSNRLRSKDKKEK